MAELIALNNHEDARGVLGVVSELPFAVKRIYFIWPEADCPSRGAHRHKVTEQLMFCTAGECKVRIVKGGEETIYTISEKGSAILLDPDDWHEMFDFSQGCALTVLASHPYDPDDYILEPL